MAKEFHIPNPLPWILSKFHRKTHREINLVPEIKGKMIKTLKLRNFIFFLCIVVASASVGVVIFFGTIVGGQGLAITSKKEFIEELDSKLKSYSDLSEFLTIKDQIGNIDTLTSNKRVLSRTFNILSAMIPTGADSIKISELNVDLSEESPVLSFEAQADAGTEPYIDYRVLDAFQKSMEYLTFDYGNYVDKYNTEIPAYCIIDTGADGATLRDTERGYYGLWTIYGEGCDPSAEVDDDGDTIGTAKEYALEDYEDQQVVRIWRTPQYKDWYRAEAEEGQPMMTDDGQISDVAHFESSCINYKVELRDGLPVKLDNTDNSCLLVPTFGEEDGGISVPESSNGRGANDDLVLRFSASITLNPDVYNFTNHHVIALPPSTRRNVTDSYIQIQNMFGARAADCAKDDTACNTNVNLNGGN